MSKTPKTDAIQNKHWNRCSPDAVRQLGNHARALEREREELREALRELYTCYAVEGTATQLGKACRRARDILAGGRVT